MKLLALDMDGTCLNSYSKISPTTMDALYLARTSGIEIVPTTGRALSCIPHQLRKTKERKTLFRALMPYEAAATIIESCQGPDLKMAAHIRHDYLLQGQLLPFFGHLIYGRDASQAKAVPDLAEFIRSRHADVEELQFFLLTKKARERTRRIVSEFPELSSARTSYYAEIYSSNATKGTALSSVADYLSVSKDEIACIGDGENDITMFQASGLRFAMGNAVPALRSMADVVVSSNNHDGVAEAVRSLLTAFL